MVYLTLDEDIPKQRYITVDAGAFVLRLSSEEARDIAVGIFQLLGSHQQESSNVVNIAEFAKQLHVAKHRVEGGGNADRRTAMPAKATPVLR